MELSRYIQVLSISRLVNGSCRVQYTQNILSCLPSLFNNNILNIYYIPTYTQIRSANLYEYNININLHYLFVRMLVHKVVQI